MRRDPMRRAGAERNATVGALLGLGLLLSNWPALAVDGVIEINQAAALAGGITACDTPGFPVSLCASGSYRLTSNLTYSSGSGIEIETRFIDLDLNGMTVQGPVTCATGLEGWVTSCTGGLSGGDAIHSVTDRARVRNGTVRGAADSCIDLAGGGAVIEDLVLTGCGTGGAILGSRSTAINIRAIGNRFFGISGNRDLSARSLLLVDNGLTGLTTTAAAEITDVVADRNNGDGILVGEGSVLKNAVATRNAADGIDAGIGSMIDTFSATSNGGSGVHLADGGLARAGVARDNGTTSNVACALQGQGGAAYREVVITSVNGGNSVTACGLVNLGNNTCMGASCPP